MIENALFYTFLSWSCSSVKTLPVSSFAGHKLGLGHKAFGLDYTVLYNQFKMQ